MGKVPCEPGWTGNLRRPQGGQTRVEKGQGLRTQLVALAPYAAEAFLLDSGPGIGGESRHRGESRAAHGDGRGLAVQKDLGAPEDEAAAIIPDREGGGPAGL